MVRGILSIGDNIRRVRLAHDMTQDEFGKIADVSAMAVSQWENDRAVPRMGAVQRLADYFHINKSDLIDESDKNYYIPPNALKPRPSMAYAPLLGRVHAGDATEPEVLDDHIPVPQEIIDAHPHGYFLEVEGDCMDKVYPPGCHIFVDPEQTPHSGSVAAVMLDDHDAVMRKLYRGADTMVLSPCSNNTTYKDIVISADDECTVQLVGTVVWFQAAEEMK